MRKLSLVLFVFILFAVSQSHAQRQNTFYATDFYGKTVGAKVAAAQASCNPSTVMPCIIVIDPTLATWATGTMPSKCSQCIWQDWRTGNGANNPLTDASANLAAWGDSLTAGAEGNANVGTWPDYYSTLSGVNIYNGGVGGQTSTQIAARFAADTTHRTWFNVIEAGRNNYSSAATVLADTAGMVSALGTKNYAVLNVISGLGETPGSGGYTNIQNLNAQLAAAYPSNYIDVWTPTLAYYDPANLLDVYDYAHGVTASSIRAQFLDTLSGALDSSSCSFTLATGPIGLTAPIVQEIKIDSEFIYVSAVSGNSVTACTRGYAGSTAAAHSSGATVTLYDNLHLNGKGYEIWANTIWAWMQSHTTNAYIGAFDFGKLGKQAAFSRVLTPLVQGANPTAPKHYQITETASGDLQISSTTGQKLVINCMPGLGCDLGSGATGFANLYGSAFLLVGGGSITKAGNGSFQFNGAGLIPGSDNTYDLGTGISSGRWRNLFLSGNLNLTGISGTQCLHSVAGVVSGTGSDCGSGGSGGATTKVWSSYVSASNQGGGSQYISGMVTGETSILTRFILSITNGATCTVQPVFEVYDFTASTQLTTLTIPNSTAFVDSGFISIPVGSAHNLRVRVSTNGTCSTYPGAIGVTVQYTS